MMGWIAISNEPFWWYGEAPNSFDPRYPDKVVLRIGIRYTDKVPAKDVEMKYLDITMLAESMECNQELQLAVPLERFIEDPGHVYVKWTSRDRTQFLRIERFSGDKWRYEQKDGEPAVPDVWATG